MVRRYLSHGRFSSPQGCYRSVHSSGFIISSVRYPLFLFSLTIKVPSGLRIYNCSVSLLPSQPHAHSSTQSNQRSRVTKPTKPFKPQSRNDSALLSRRTLQMNRSKWSRQKPRCLRRPSSTLPFDRHGSSTVFFGHFAQSLRLTPEPDLVLEAHLAHWAVGSDSHRPFLTECCYQSAQHKVF